MSHFLSLHAFMSHHSSAVELPDRGVVLVTGPNGAGKSAIVEGFATALWGKSLRGRWTPWRGEEPGVVHLVSQGLRVERRWTGKGKVLSWRREGTTEETHDTTSKAQEGLDHIVGPFEVWRRTSVFSSADAANFTMATDAERKALLEQLLGLEWFERALTACRADLRAANGALGAAQRDADVAGSRAQALAENVRMLEGQLAEMAPPEDVGMLKARVAQIQTHLDQLNDERVANRKRQRELNMVDARDEERRDAAERKLDRLGEGSCEACGQPVPEALVSSLVAEAKEAKSTAEQKRRAVHAELVALEDADRELAEEYLELQKVQGQAQAQVRAIESMRAARARAEHNLREAGAEVRKVSEKLAAILLKQEQLRVDVAELETCERVLGVRGARAHVVGKTLAGIEACANSWLGRLSADIQVKLSSYTEKKSGGVADAISLGIIGAGGEQGYLGASAGERRRVDVAILLALAELGAASHVAEWVSPVFFDEVFDSLDGDGREAVLELVHNLALTRCVVLITHDESVASMRADLRIRVDGGRIS